MTTSAQCAQIGIAATLCGQTNIVTGFTNALGMWLLHFIPRSLLAMVAHRGMASAVDKAPKR
jgi:hypothetical protein